MNRYDIVFIGHMALGTIVPFEAAPFIERGSPVLYASIAASCLPKRISVATRIPDGMDYLLEPMRAAGIDLFVQPGEIIRFRVVFPSANLDERQPIHETNADIFVVDDTLAFDQCLTHSCWIGPGRLQLNLMREMKARGFRLSVDMQGFMFQTDKETGIASLKDVPEKKEILSMVDFVKLDALEAKVLTGADALQDQADILESWGSPETVITCSEGAFAQRDGKSAFARFTNRRILGRMGRGDTCMGAYLARRLDHSLEDSVRFAAAATSIKLESYGPFTGSAEDVIARMNAK